MKAGGAGEKLYDGFTVAEHYKEWLRWYQEFFRNRIREGLGCEIAHPSSYGMSTIGHIYDIENLTDSAALKKAAGNFLTVFWANVACEFEPRTGIRAGIASTRNYKWTWNQQGSLYWARSLLYAYGWTDIKAAPNLTQAAFYVCGYRPPEILRAIASDTKRGPYMGTSRRFGRSKGRWKNGIYQVVFDDGEAHNCSIRRDTWYTQAYTMSTLSFDPAREYIELLNQSRVMGVTFSSGIDDRLVVYAGNTPTSAEIEYKMGTSKEVNGMLGADCLIAARDPNANPETSNSTRIFIPNGALWDKRREDGGWLFTRAGDGYAAIRIAGDKGFSATATPRKSGHFLEFNDIWAPVVIQMGQSEKFASFEAFQAAVKAQPFTYAEGKLTYTALNGETYAYRGNSKTLPTLNGKPLDLNPAMTYDFPYLKMKHGTDTATISYPGYPDFLVSSADGDGR